MKNNKIVTYAGILAVGLLLGWLLFGSASSMKESTSHDHTEVSEANQMWTCSMHPQIMQSEPGDCPICGMDLIPAETGSESLSVNQFSLSETALALADIQTTVVQGSSLRGNSIKLSGKIVENEEENAVQVSYFSGRIERLYVNYTGEEVSKGKLLATIYSPELIAAQQELITAASLKESQPALYNAVRNKLKLWKLSENQINQIEISGKVRENFPVYATVSGTVSEKLVEEGESVKQGQPLLKIANLNTVWASFDVYESQINLFEQGQEIVITTQADPNEKYKAKVSFIDPVLDGKTRTVKLRAVLDNKKDVFKPGMFVEGQLEGRSGKAENLITIPSSAVLWTGERSVVYVKVNENEPVFEMREISLGNSVGENYEVKEGLFSGEEIVTNGAFTVDAAAQLQGKKSMMNKEGGKTSTGHEGHLGMNTSNSNSENLNTHERIKVSSNFQMQLKSVFDDYIGLKDAFISEDSKAVKLYTKELLSSIDKVDMNLLKDGTAHDRWMVLEGKIKSASNSIINTSNLSSQRKYFKELSSQLSYAIQLFGINEKVYNLYCPMANNNQGAYWLSTEKKILNPYFGEAMLTCGEVKQIIE
ncbi:efflux RND transporter periplasmic adaptor subunit [Pukyongia salina]|uniref:Efflux RND transporter periplasmic adaptor subunit n=1 Tax=Pukyongia salina TaxID=2094025 RepID=A0A2S0HYI5_9FLAO|nr:efflux RND transporter periplasmic adaptor subunit [Pukyongia salina]AVI51666.1 efflux RND transporter periplasmic adaptor subunit [Pukyongia salina]